MRLTKLTLAMTLAVGAIGMISSCGALNGTSTDDSDAVANPVNVDRVTPPKEYYTALMQRELDSIHLPFGLAGNTLYLNFDGAVIEKGFNVGESFLACADTVTIPPALLADSDRAEIVNAVQRYFVSAKAALRVVTSKPVIGDYTTVIVGGEPSDLGCPGLTKAIGLAPFDVGNVNANDIAFVFNRGNEDSAALAMAVAHEAGHTFGLDHVRNPQSLMNPAISADVVGFLPGQLLTGKGSQDAAAVLQKVLGTLGQQPVNPDGSVVPVPAANLFAQIARMLTTIGVDPNLTSLFANVTILIDQSIPGGITGTPGMDRVIAVLNVIATNFDPNNPSTLTPANAVASVVKIVEIITGKPVDQTPWIGALTAILSGTNMNVVLDSVIDILARNNANNGVLNAVVNSGALNNADQLATLLRLDDAKTPDAQLATLRLQKAHVWGAYKGDTRDALLSLLKAGHMGAWARFN